MKKFAARLRYWLTCFDYITRDVYDLERSADAVIKAKKKLDETK